MRAKLSEFSVAQQPQCTCAYAYSHISYNAVVSEKLLYFVKMTIYLHKCDFAKSTDI